MLRSLAARIAIAALLCVGAAPASAQDPVAVSAAPEPTPPPSLLARATADARRRMHLHVMARLEAIATAQARIAASHDIDEDGDGAGEFAGFQGLSGAIATRGGKLVDPGFLDETFGDVDESGRLTMDGYVYRIWLPGADGRGVSEVRGAPLAPGVKTSPAAAARRWCCYAWPERYPATGRLTYFICEDGIVLCTDAPGYGGRGPAAGAAFVGGDGLDRLTGTPSAGKEAQDRHVWITARDLDPSRVAALPAPYPGSPWRDLGVIRRCFKDACDAVQEECGAKFNGTPPTIAIGSWRQVRRALDAEVRATRTAQGEDPKQLDYELDAAASLALAKYDVANNRILVVPDTIELLAEICDASWVHREDTVRVLLYHEVTHALDHERFPLTAAVREAPNEDRMHALGAVIEGHAQFVAERAAKANDLGPAFGKLCSLQSAQPFAFAREKKAARVDASGRFAYERGLSFFRAVHQAGGIAAVDEVLRTPPVCAALVQRPSLWISGRRDDPGVECRPLLLALLPALPDGPDSRTIPMLVTDYENDVGVGPGPLEGYEAGHAMQTTVKSGAVGRVQVLAFDSPEHAARFVGALRSELTSPRSGAARVKDGAAGGKLPGVSWRRNVPNGDKTVEEHGQMAPVGRFVLGVSYEGDSAPSQERQDEGLVRAADLASKP